MKIKLVDKNIKHLHNYSGYDTSKYFEWYKGHDPADIIVFTDHMLGHANKLSTEYSSKYKVAWVMEPPCINTAHWKLMEQEGVREMYDYIFTYSQYAIKAWGEKAMWYPGGGSMMYKRQWQIYPKEKNILLVVSDKGFAIGHRFRRELTYRYKGRVDVIGRGHKPFPEDGRAEAYKDYRFQIYVQNMIMEDMWGDRLIDCFLTGTVPIVWGGHFLYKYFNDKGIFTFKDQFDLDEIIDYVERDGKALYSEMMPHIRDNFERAKKYGIVEDYFWENLFGKL